MQAEESVKISSSKKRGRIPNTVELNHALPMTSLPNLDIAQTIGNPTTADTDTDLNSCSSASAFALHSDLASCLPAVPLREHGQDAPRPSKEVQNTTPQIGQPKTRLGRGEQAFILFSDDSLEYKSFSRDQSRTTVSPAMPVADAQLDQEMQAVPGTDIPSISLPQDFKWPSPANEMVHSRKRFSESETAVTKSIDDAIWKFHCFSRPPLTPANPLSGGANVKPRATTDEMDFFVDDVWSKTTLQASGTSKSWAEVINDTLQPPQGSSPSALWLVYDGRNDTPTLVNTIPLFLSEIAQQFDICSEFQRVLQCLIVSQDTETLGKLAQIAHPMALSASSSAVKSSSFIEMVASQVTIVRPPMLAVRSTDCLSVLFRRKPSAEIRARARRSISQLPLSAKFSPVVVTLPLSRPTNDRNVSMTARDRTKTVRRVLSEAASRSKPNNEQQVTTSRLQSSTKQVRPVQQPVLHPSGLDGVWHSGERSSPYIRDVTSSSDTLVAAEAARSSSNSPGVVVVKKSSWSRLTEVGTTRPLRRKSTYEFGKSRQDRGVRMSNNCKKESWPSKASEFVPTKTAIESPETKSETPSAEKSDSKPPKRYGSVPRKRAGKDLVRALTNGHQAKDIPTKHVPPTAVRHSRLSTNTVNMTVPSSVKNQADNAVRVTPAKENHPCETSSHKTAPILPQNATFEEQSYLRDLTPASNEAVLHTERTRISYKQNASFDKGGGLRTKENDTGSVARRETYIRPSSLHVNTKRQLGLANSPRWLKTVASDATLGPFRSAVPIDESSTVQNRDCVITPLGFKRLPESSRVILVLSSAEDAAEGTISGPQQPMVTRSHAARDQKLSAMVEPMMQRRTSRCSDLGETTTPESAKHQPEEPSSQDRPRQLMRRLQEASQLLQRHLCLKQRTTAATATELGDRH